MEKLTLVRPAAEHKMEYEAMMDEWEAYGGRFVKEVMDEEAGELVQIYFL